MKESISMNFFETIRQFKLLPPSVSIPKGFYEVHWVGPKWFQFVAKHGLAVFGFKNWMGKDFSGNLDAMNVFWDSKRSELTNRFPMEVSLHPSKIDSKICIRVNYPRSTHFPWPFVIDEFRLYDSNIMIGLSYAKGLSLLPLPFLLIKKERVE
jgi:hypothetical protein